MSASGPATAAKKCTDLSLSRMLTGTVRVHEYFSIHMMFASMDSVYRCRTFFE